MPELPEVEVLVRHLAPRLRGRTIRGVEVKRARVLQPTSAARIESTLVGAKFIRATRRAKYLVFTLTRRGQSVTLLGHLGMTGRMYLAPQNSSLPKHAAVVLDLGKQRLIYEDTRYFGRLTLDASALAALGPEPLGDEFTVEHFTAALKRSAQPIKVKLLDQQVVAGLGNIYASEALFRAPISPRVAARRLTREQIVRLRRAIRSVLREAIAGGSTVPLNFSGEKRGDGLFYFGRAPGANEDYSERLRVYDRAGEPCSRCGTPIRRIVQAARSTYFCPQCQR